MHSTYRHDRAKWVAALRALRAPEPSPAMRFSSGRDGHISFGKPFDEYPWERAARLGTVTVEARVTGHDETGTTLAITCSFCAGVDEIVVTEDWEPGEAVQSGCNWGTYRVLIKGDREKQ